MRMSKSTTNKYSYYAVVTDGLWRKSLSVIRSIGKQNYHITVIGDSIFTVGFWSRFTKNRVISSVASKNRQEFGENLINLLKGYSAINKPVLFPMEDASIIWVAENLTEIKELAHVLIPPKDSLAIAEDKNRTLKAAEKLNLPIPQTFSPSDLSHLRIILNQLEVDHPNKKYIVKPITGSGSSGIIYNVFDSSIDWKHHWDLHGALLIQERLAPEGKGIGVSLLMDRNEECVAYFVHERLQQYPNTGGPSTDRQSVHNPELVGLSIKLLKSLSWTGVAMVEWKMDTSNNTPKLMEINPRFWGSLELAVRAGVDFPSLYAKAAVGETLGVPPRYPAGIRCRWLIPGDILRYITHPRSSREGLKSFLKGLPTTAEEWDREDIRGTLASIICPALLVINPKYWKYLRRRG
jgi:predicted ATP-grasp superfamily ATP-dependent carboligase